MSSSKFSISFVAILVVMVAICQITSATDSHASSSSFNGASNGTLANKPAVPVPSNNHVNANATHLRVRRKGIGGAVAGGVASGAAMTAIGSLFGGRV